MLRYLALTLLMGCSASAGGASFDGPADDEPLGQAGAPAEPVAGAPAIGGSDAAGSLSVGGASAGSPVVKGGQEPVAGAPAAGAASGGQAGQAGAGGAAATAGSPSAGSPPACPSDYYCHELGPDAFAKCVVRPAPDDPQFPMCTITEGACFYPKDAPESCIKPECWSKKRTCD
jgi:hypothetical protein